VEPSRLSESDDGNESDGRSGFAEEFGEFAELRVRFTSPGRSKKLTYS
jgi:hypothetical protein